MSTFIPVSVEEPQSPFGYNGGAAGFSAPPVANPSSNRGQPQGFGLFPTPTFSPPTPAFAAPIPQFGVPQQQPQYNRPPFPAPQPQFGTPQNPQYAQPQVQAEGGYYNPMMDLNSPIAQLGVEGAKTFLGNMQVQTFAKRWFSSLRFYFAVDTSYVFQKLRILLFPFMHKSFSRRLAQQDLNFLPPSQDINAPDLYIPVMAFVTYVLLIGFFMGAQLKFHPDILGLTASSAAVSLMIEVLLVKLGLFVFNLTPIPFLDLIAYCGYKFVSAVINISIGLVFGTLFFYIAYVANTLLFSVFMVKTFRNLIPKQQESSNVLRTNFLLFVAAIQFLFVFFLCYLDYSAISAGSDKRSSFNIFDFFISLFGSKTAAPA